MPRSTNSRRCDVAVRDVIRLCARLVVVTDIVVVLEQPLLCNASSILYRVSSDSLACDSSKNCPQWMYCDTRPSEPTCMSCTVCSPGDVEHAPCFSPVKCVQSLSSTSEPRLFCAALEIAEGEKCWANCKPRPTRYGYPLGTQCNVECTSATESSRLLCTYNYTMTRANWNSHLPHGVRLQDRNTFISHDSSGSRTTLNLLPETLRTVSTTYLVHEPHDKKLKATETEVLSTSLVVVSAVIVAALISLLTTLAAVRWYARRMSALSKEVSMPQRACTLEQSSFCNITDHDQCDIRDPTRCVATENSWDSLPTGNPSQEPVELSDSECTETMPTMSRPPNYTCCCTTSHQFVRCPVGLHQQQQQQQQQPGPLLLSESSQIPESVSREHISDYHGSNYRFLSVTTCRPTTNYNNWEQVVDGCTALSSLESNDSLNTKDCSETLCKSP